METYLLCNKRYVLVVQVVWKYVFLFNSLFSFIKTVFFFVFMLKRFFSCYKLKRNFKKYSFGNGIDLKINQLFFVFVWNRKKKVSEFFLYFNICNKNLTSQNFFFILTSVTKILKLFWTKKVTHPIDISIL